MNAATDNGFGLNWPLRAVAETCAQMGIRPEHRVLEVGGAGNPFARANVVCDLTFAACAQRNGAPGVFRPDVAYVEAPAEKLPFADGEFDFVYCTQVLEHVQDPLAACRELSRVARRGFVETPSRAGELINGNPTHRWIVDREGDALVFTPRPFVEHPLRNFFYGVLFRDATLRALVEHDFRNLMNHQILFEGRLQARVNPGAGTFSYDDAAHAARAHLSFAANTLRGGADPQYGWPDALEALRLMPHDEAVRRLVALYQLRLLRPADARATLAGLCDELSATLERCAIAMLEGRTVDPGLLPVPEVSAALPAPQHRPRVSLIVTGSEAESLRQSVESALTQDHPDCEVIVSAPLPLEQVLRGLSMGPRLKLMEQPAGTGAGQCWNAAAVHVTGEQVGFVEAPCRLLAHHAERLSGMLTLSGADAVCADVIALDRGVIHAELRTGNPVLAVLPLAAVLVRAEAALRCGPFDSGSAGAASGWMSRLIQSARVHSVCEATVKVASLEGPGVNPLSAAEAALSLKPLELLRDLMAAHVREQGLRAQLEALREGRG